MAKSAFVVSNKIPSASPAEIADATKGFNVDRQAGSLVIVETSADTFQLVTPAVTGTGWAVANSAASTEIAVTALTQVGTNASDRPSVVSSSGAAYAFGPAVAIADLSDGDNPVNRTALSGKKKGRCVLVQEASSRFSLAIAQGSDPESTWSMQDAGATDRVITPSAPTTFPAAWSVGDNEVRFPASESPAICESFGGFVTAAELADVADKLNDDFESGKRYGSVVVVDSTPMRLYVATGPLAADSWEQLSGADSVTPA